VPPGPGLTSGVYVGPALSIQATRAPLVLPARSELVDKHRVHPPPGLNKRWLAQVIP
jgi:hypothetical protein